MRGAGLRSKGIKGKQARNRRSTHDAHGVLVNDTGQIAADAREAWMLRVGRLDSLAIFGDRTEEEVKLLVRILASPRVIDNIRGCVSARNQSHVVAADQG